MMRFRYGNIWRKADTVAGAAAVSNRAVNVCPAAVTVEFLHCAAPYANG